MLFIPDILIKKMNILILKLKIYNNMIKKVNKHVNNKILEKIFLNKFYF